MKRIVIAVLVGVGLTLVGAGVAAAQDEFPDDHPANAQGQCTARAELSNGVTVDPYASGGTYVLPLEGSATYTATTPWSGDDRPIRGSVKIQTPPGIPDITIDDKWVWDDRSDSSFDTDTVTWEFPSSIPRSVELTVEGEHYDDDVRTCHGSIKIEIDGGFFDSFVGWVALGGTVVSGTGVALSAVSKTTKSTGAAVSQAAATVPGAGTATVAAPPPDPAPTPPPHTPGAGPPDPKATVVDPDAPTVMNPETDPTEGGGS